MPLSKRQLFIRKTEQTINHLVIVMSYLLVIIDYIKFSKWKKQVRKIERHCNAAIKGLKKVYKEWR